MAADRALRFQRRGTVVMAIVLIALLAFGTTTQTWLTVDLPQDAVQTPSLNVAGSDAATPVTAFALVSLAGAFAVSIAGRIGRWLVAALLLVAGVGIAVVSLQVIRDPTAAAAVWLALAGRSWGRTRRYDKNPQATDPARESAHGGEIDSWDRLTHGEDPTR
ncbi:Trp biosynthesis-associated membrane protein [Arthrobacter sp. Br18]|uniref:Trp biosynthesis-associated membrane protein n=1 Tax=Arthrobacter sp. Br18 TaxID=1312954 RepID=UPI0004B52943|nr:Trp biosynthesis-associated membrane protein [Arthrobacter sp. Br18]